MKKYEVKDHEPSLLPDGYEFELVWSDEFDGDTLDETKWDYRLCMMGKRHPAWTDKGVKIEDGCAVFRIFEENGEIVSSQLQTGYNFMDEPVKPTKFGILSFNGLLANLKRISLLTSMDIMSADVDFKSKRVGGARSGYNLQISALRLIQKCRVAKLILWNPSIQATFIRTTSLPVDTDRICNA
jgi:hypothetical protein